MNFVTPEMTVHALLLTSRDSGVSGKCLHIITQERGRMTVFAPQGRRVGNKIGGLLPGSCMVLSLRQERGAWHIIQAEGRVLVDVLAWDYEEWLCYYAYPAWLEALFPTEEYEPALYRLTKRYLSALATKQIAISTLTACWQAAVIAGYDPMVPATEGNLFLDRRGTEALRKMVAYSWGQSETVVYGNRVLVQLAHALIYFARYHVGGDVPALAALVKEKY